MFQSLEQEQEVNLNDMYILYSARNDKYTDEYRRNHIKDKSLLFGNCSSLGMPDLIVDIIHRNNIKMVMSVLTKEYFNSIKHGIYKINLVKRTHENYLTTEEIHENVINMVEENSNKLLDIVQEVGIVDIIYGYTFDYSNILECFLNKHGTNNKQCLPKCFFPEVPSNFGNLEYNYGSNFIYLLDNDVFPNPITNPQNFHYWHGNYNQYDPVHYFRNTFFHGKDRIFSNSFLHYMIDNYISTLSRQLQFIFYTEAIENMCDIIVNNKQAINFLTKEEVLLKSLLKKNVFPCDDELQLLVQNQGKDVWDRLIESQELTYDFIITNEEHIDINLYSKHHNLSERFITRFSTEICWESVLNNQLLDKEFIKNYPEELYKFYQRKHD